MKSEGDVAGLGSERACEFLPSVLVVVCTLCFFE